MEIKRTNSHIVMLSQINNVVTTDIEKSISVDIEGKKQ